MMILSSAKRLYSGDMYKNNKKRKEKVMGQRFLPRTNFVSKNEQTVLNNKSTCTLAKTLHSQRSYTNQQLESIPI